MAMAVIFDLDLLKDLSLVVLASTIFAFLIAFPVIHFLYKFNITRRMTVDFTTLIEKRNLKIGVPVMGGLIMVLTVIIFNLLANPEKDSKGLFLTLFIFTLSAVLGGADDIMNIFGFERAKQRAFSRTLTLIKVHKSLRKRIWLTITLPWEAYKRFFYMLGSNPGKGIQAHEKILVQSIAGLALGVGLYFFSSIEKPGLLWIPLFDFDMNIGILLIPFAWIAVLLMTNAVNLADGMDGLAASELMASFLGFLVIAILKDDVRMSFLITTVLGSLIAYLYFNIPPARFQMGDVGSLAMGTLLATVAFMLKEPLMLLFISFPFVLTLLSAVIQGIGRRILGRRIFRMAPLQYHFQMKYGWSEEKVVMRLGLFSVVCMIVGLWVFTMR
jgi:UDP-N-acetylmuramyl pentapeptide phosphotransferase/UDP-N-acetylglucosamine-1-phosphate transferase